ncbi:NTF2 fold immunity protein [Capnocytophaga haemolytica]|uniref:NTF2 fold immunity protein domain-containing protein n=1 Tax=Capnocytophaga haemolytica TaxID=45243 RepID=A0AAX2H048_9FLAO|nr:NTF2 fold immunity protein [Capnocytophaga haemolytica]AMD84236.1 hypothetical protein AXF12_01005 [Capnocytophaga haemolytica]SFN95290.1 NTF2 fold immunity protein [Capnocytophaga haemolytica]SNV12408.1 Uncharacterised protein [Capnocytophaga haemolytica]
MHIAITIKQENWLLMNWWGGALIPIYDRYITDKLRKRSRIVKGMHYGFPPYFDTDLENIDEVIVKEHKAEVSSLLTYKGKPRQRKYFLIKDGERWLLDSIKERYLNETEWRTMNV